MANVEGAIVVQGLADMQRVLRKAEHELAPQLRQRLKETGEGIVAPAARRYAPRGVRSARYRFGGRDLSESIRVSATQRGASVYSTAIYGGVQNYGGRVGRNHATVLRRADVSGYMTRAVADTRTRATEHVEGVLDWLQHELGS